MIPSGIVQAQLCFVWAQFATPAIFLARHTFKIIANKTKLNLFRAQKFYTIAQTDLSRLVGAAS